MGRITTFVLKTAERIIPMIIGGLIGIWVIFYFTWSAGYYLGEKLLEVPNLNSAKIMNIAGNVLNLIGILLISSTLVKSRIGRSFLENAAPFIGIFLFLMLASLSDFISTKSFDALKPYALIDSDDIKTAELRLQNWFTADQLSLHASALFLFGPLLIYAFVDTLVKAWNWLARRFQLRIYPTFIGARVFGGSLFCYGLVLQLISSIVDLQEEPQYLLKTSDLTTLSEFPEYSARKSPETKGVLTAIAFSPNGKVLAAADNKGIVVLWDLKTFEILGRLKPSDEFFPSSSALAFSQDGRRLGVISRKGNVVVWDVALMKIIDSFHSVFPVALVFNGEDAMIASVLDETITVSRLNDGKPLGENSLTNHRTIMDMAFSVNGSTLAAVKAGNLMVAKILRDHIDWHELDIANEALPVSLSLSADGEQIVIGFANGHVLMKDALSGRTHGWRAVHHGPVLATAVTPTGDVIASAGADRTVVLFTQSESDEWRSRTLRRQHNAPISSVTLSADGKLLASGSWDGTVMLWKVNCRLADGMLVHGCALAVLGQRSGSAVREALR